MPLMSDPWFLTKRHIARPPPGSLFPLRGHAPGAPRPHSLSRQWAEQTGVVLHTFYLGGRGGGAEEGGVDFTADLPHNHQHPPLCSLRNPLIPTVISFVFVVV